MRFFQTIAYSLTVWLLAAVINAFLVAVFFAIIQTDTKGMLSFVPAMAGSLIFSAPGIFCFWVFFLVAVYRNLSVQSLFRLLLCTGICCALCTGAVVGYILRSAPGMSVLSAALIAVAAAMLSLFAHRGAFIFINKPSTSPDHV